MSQTRKLAAIMFADIEGYTAMMQRSEDEALLVRSKYRQVFERLVPAYQGKIVQHYGDGTLCVFDSAAKAVRCAIEIQHDMQEPPEIPLRIGIHSGDIVVAEDGIIGDSVNIASRVESLGSPGSILISDKLYGEVRNISSIRTRFCGNQKLKNVQQPVGIHAVANEGIFVPTRKDITEKASVTTGNKKLLPYVALGVLLLLIVSFWFGTRSGDSGLFDRDITVAVLPFDLEEEVKADEFLASSLSDGLIHEVSRINQLTVLHPSSAQVLAASIGSVDLKFAENTAGADYVITGKVDKSGSTFELDVRLADGLEQEAFWSKHYRRDISAMRKLWGEIANDLALELGVRLDPGLIESWRQLRPVDPRTYELYLKGMHHLNMSDPVEWQKGMAFFEEAISRNPTDAYAYAGLAEAFIRLGHGPAPPPDVFPKALEAATRSIELDSNLADGWAALCHYQTYFGWDWQLADETFHRSNAINPNLAWNHYHRAWYLALFGRMDEAFEEHLRAKELDPFTPEHSAWLGELYRWVGRYDDALEIADEASKLQDNYALSMLIKGFVYSAQEDWNLALKYHTEAAQINPGWKYVGLGPTLIKSGRIEEGRAIINELESMPPTPFGALMLGTMYSLLDDVDKSIEWLSYPEKHGWYPWIRVMFIEGKTREDPRFLELIREMGLPDPAPLRYNL